MLNILKRILLLLLFSSVVLLTGTARAANFTVNNNADTSDVAAGNGICADALGNCTLRAAVQEANALAGDDSISFAASLMNATITLTTGLEIQINGVNGTLQINGLGADKLTIDGGLGSNRIFSINAATVTITGLKLQGGGNPGGFGLDGGAIFADGSTIVLNSIFVQNNNAQTSGGGIYLNNGVNRILNSTISGNSSFSSGGIYQSGGMLFIANSTISGNTASGQGGGITIGNTTATFRNTTITNNSAASAGGGIQVGGSIFNMGNTIIAGNNAGGGNPEILSFSVINSAGNNFIGDSPGDSIDTNVPVNYQMSDIRDQNPLLGVLQNNGGPTPTHALLVGSPAINAGDNAKAVDPFDNSPLTSDQRGFIPRTTGGTVDIGAYEFNSAPTAASVSVSGQILAGKTGVNRAVVYLTDGNGATRTALTNSFGYYRFDDVEVGQTYIFSVSHRRYTFAPQVLNLIEETNDLNFSANQ